MFKLKALKIYSNIAYIFSILLAEIKKLFI